MPACTKHKSDISLRVVVEADFRPLAASLGGDAASCRFNARHVCLKPTMSISNRFSAKLVDNLWIASNSDLASVTEVTGNGDFPLCAAT